MYSEGAKEERKKTLLHCYPSFGSKGRFFKKQADLRAAEIAVGGEQTGPVLGAALANLGLLILASSAPRECHAARSQVDVTSGDGFRRFDV